MDLYSIFRENEIRIRISVKTWIRICIRVKILDTKGLIVEFLRAVDAHVVGVEAQYEALEGC
jgi:hypothetical protein